MPHTLFLIEMHFHHAVLDLIWRLVEIIMQLFTDTLSCTALLKHPPPAQTAPVPSLQHRHHQQQADPLHLANPLGLARRTFAFRTLMVFGIISVCGVIFVATVTNWLPSAYASSSAGRLTGPLPPPRPSPALAPAACVPPGFGVGAGSSAFQTEGSPAAGGRTPSIWDAFARQPGRIADGSTADPAADSYNRWRSDVDAVTAIHARAYRFSISWSRLMHPNGTANTEGVRFYSSLAQSLRAAGVEPVATLYHFDLPLWLDDPENYPLTHVSTTNPVTTDGSASNESSDKAAAAATVAAKESAEWTRAALADAAKRLNFPAMLDTSRDSPAVKRAMMRALRLAGLGEGGALLPPAEGRGRGRERDRLGRTSSSSTSSRRSSGSRSSGSTNDERSSSDDTVSTHVQHLGGPIRG